MAISRFTKKGPREIVFTHTLQFHYIQSISLCDVLTTVYSSETDLQVSLNTVFQMFHPRLVVRGVVIIFRELIAFLPVFPPLCYRPAFILKARRSPWKTPS